MKLFANPPMAHMGFSDCVGPVELADKDAVHRDIARFKSVDWRRRSVGAPFRGRSARAKSPSTTPTSTTVRTRSTWRRARTRSRPSTTRS